MNWNQYFQLKETQKKHFKKIFIILIIISIFIYKDIMIEGSEKTCNRLFPQPDLAGDSETKALDISANQSNKTDNSSAYSINSQQAEIMPPLLLFNSLKNHLWLDCKNEYSTLTQDGKVLYIKAKLLYSPLFIIYDFVIAYVLSIMIFIYSNYKAKNAKDEAPKEEKKDEKNK